MTPDELVTEFCRRWADPDPAVLASYFTDDAVYHNIPMEPVRGRAAIEEFIAGFVASFGGIDFRIRHQAVHGGVVLNERVDVFTLGGADRGTAGDGGLRGRRRQDRRLARLLRPGADHRGGAAGSGGLIPGLAVVGRR